MNEASGSETTVAMDNMLKTNRSRSVLALLLPPLAAFVIIASIWEITAVSYTHLTLPTKA